MMSILTTIVVLVLQGIAVPDTRPDGLGEMLKEHSLWLQSHGVSGVRADLRGMDLENFPPRPTGGVPSKDLLLSGGVVLRGVDLRQADIRFARLRSVDLSGANLQYARFNETDLRRATLVDSDLQHADLSKANLAGADLRGSNLNNAVFAGTDLSSADLTGAKCLNKEQVAGAKIDIDTKLPTFEDCPEH